LSAKGSVMGTRGASLALISLSVLTVILAGCAKRPALTQASTPAPTTMSAPPVAPAPASPSTPPAAPPVPAPAAVPAPAPAPAPAPVAAVPRAARDFEPTPALKPIHFDFDKYVIRPGDARILDANVRWLNANANQLALIEGHCDERGTSEYNLALGERRAKATMNYLVTRGVAASRITIISYGEERPLCPANNEACWSQNRRAQFLVKPRE
jgi:peptidoglycan-associated lipoprotein